MPSLLRFQHPRVLRLAMAEAMRPGTLMMAARGRWAATPLDHDLMNFENAATVRLAATFGLIDCRDKEFVAEVLHREDTRNIDYIPVRRKKRRWP